MQDNVDYRLLERFRAKRHLNVQPALQPDAQKRVAAAVASSRLPAIELRD